MWKTLNSRQTPANLHLFAMSSFLNRWCSWIHSRLFLRWGDFPSVRFFFLWITLTVLKQYLSIFLCLQWIKWPCVMRKGWRGHWKWQANRELSWSAVSSMEGFNIFHCFPFMVQNCTVGSSLIALISLVFKMQRAAFLAKMLTVYHLPSTKWLSDKMSG